MLHYFFYFLSNILHVTFRLVCIQMKTSVAMLKHKNRLINFKKYRDKYRLCFESLTNQIFSFFFIRLIFALHFRIKNMTYFMTFHFCLFYN